MKPARECAFLLFDGLLRGEADSMALCAWLGSEDRARAAAFLGLCVFLGLGVALEEVEQVLIALYALQLDV